MQSFVIAHPPHRPTRCKGQLVTRLLVNGRYYVVKPCALDGLQAGRIDLDEQDLDDDQSDDPIESDWS